ncbi:MAG: hypothetical protein ACI81V_000992 [Lentimonas sp.]|jgi:hypothetical protein
MKFAPLMLLLALPLCADPARSIQFNVYAQSAANQLVYQPVEPPPQGRMPLTELKAIQSHPLARTGPYPFKGGDRIDFYNATTHSMEAQVRIPPHSNHWLLVFTKNPYYQKKSGALKYRILPVDERSLNRPANQVVFLNLSNLDLTGLLNQQQLQLPAGQSSPYPVNGQTSIQLWIGPRKQRSPCAWLKNCNFQSGQRPLILLFAPILSGSGDLDVRQLSDEEPATESSLN